MVGQYDHMLSLIAGRSVCCGRRRLQRLIVKPCRWSSRRRNVTIATPAVYQTFLLEQSCWYNIPSRNAGRMWVKSLKNAMEATALWCDLKVGEFTGVTGVFWSCIHHHHEDIFSLFRCCVFVWSFVVYLWAYAFPSPLFRLLVFWVFSEIRDSWEGRVVLGRCMWCWTCACGDIHAVVCQVLVLVHYSHQAYIVSCNDTDYSFFGSLNYQQTGVHVEGIAGHNTGVRMHNFLSQTEQEVV